MQNLETLEAAVTLQFLQHNAQYQASVTLTSNSRRGLDEEGQWLEEQNRWTEEELLRVQVWTKSRLQRRRRPRHHWAPQPVKSQEPPRTTPATDEDESYETGYILAAVQHSEPFRQSKEWFGVRVLGMIMCAFHKMFS